MPQHTLRKMACLHAPVHVIQLLLAQHHVTVCFTGSRSLDR
jgi:hypothetical protein